MKTHFVPFVLFVAQLAFLCTLLGCYNPQRDLSIDPHNTPLIHIPAAAYDAPTGMVVVQWEYLGQKPVENFVLQRGETSAFRNVAHFSGASAQGKYATVGAFRDGDLIAGETMQYRVVAEYSEGGSARTAVVDVPIPGAGLREIRRDPVSLAVQVVWQPGRGAKYEVIRTTAGGDSETIFTTQDSQQTSFWDASIADNRPYQYAIRSHLPTGVQLTSRSAQVQFYRNAGHHIVEPLHSEERMRLAATELDGEAYMLALIGRAGRVSLSRFRHTLNTEFLVWDDLVPQSLDLAGLPPGTRSASPRVYIGGITPDGRVMILGVDPRVAAHNTVVWQLPDHWISRSSRVRLAQDEQQRIYVATDGQLRVYSADGNRLGALDFAQGDPVDIAVHNGAIWAAWGNRVRRGRARFSDEMFAGIAWENVSLDLPDDPIAMTLNAAGQVVALHRAGVHVFRANGTALISWALPPGAYATADVTIFRGRVHVSNENGEVIVYVP